MIKNALFRRDFFNWFKHIVRPKKIPVKKKNKIEADIKKSGTIKEDVIIIEFNNDNND